MPPNPSSGENRTTMHKCYTFLIFMVLLLPSLGLSRWVSEEGVGAGVGDGKKGSSQGLQVWGVSSELVDGTLSPLVFWLLQPQHLHLLSSPPQPGPLLPLAL